jgi:hypothetical protein
MHQPGAAVRALLRAVRGRDLGALPAHQRDPTAAARMSIVSLGYVSGEVLDTNAQIARLEEQIERGEVEQLLTVALLKGPGPLLRVSLAPMGAAAPRIREMLRLAMEAVERTYGPAGPA